MANDLVPTPREFLDAVESRFGTIDFDIAANKQNNVTQSYRFFGPGSTLAENALTVDWPHFGLNWLNPPFSNIAGFAKKACAERYMGAKTAMLMPASVCTNYFSDYVRKHAYVFELMPRVFKKEIRDCILALFTPEGYVGREEWIWK